MNQLAGPRTVLGPFTAREVTYLGGAVLLALASLFSFGRTRGDFVVIMLCLLAPLGAAAAMAWKERVMVISISLWVKTARRVRWPCPCLTRQTVERMAQKAPNIVSGGTHPILERAKHHGSAA